jgi:hypothetical protein
VISTAVGGDLDWRLTNHLRVRAGEVDDLLTHLTEVNGANTRVQDNFRIRSELVLRFERISRPPTGFAGRPFKKVGPRISQAGCGPSHFLWINRND